MNDVVRSGTNHHDVTGGFPQGRHERSEFFQSAYRAVGLVKDFIVHVELQTQVPYFAQGFQHVARDEWQIGGCPNAGGGHQVGQKTFHRKGHGNKGPGNGTQHNEL